MLPSSIVFTIELSIDLFPFPINKEIISMKLKFYCFERFSKKEVDQKIIKSLKKHDQCFYWLQ